MPNLDFGLVFCVLIAYVVSVSASRLTFISENNEISNELSSSKVSNFENVFKFFTKVEENEILEKPDNLTKIETLTRNAVKSEQWTKLAHLIRSGSALTSDIMELKSWNKLFHDDRVMKKLFKRTKFIVPTTNDSVEVETVLLWSCMKGYYNLTEFLINIGTDLNSPLLGNSHLWLPLTRGNYKMVHLLLSKGAQINAKDKHGWTLLHTAALLDENIYVLNFLLTNGLDVNVLSKNGFTPLDVANGGSWSYLKEKGGMTSRDLHLKQRNIE